MRTLAQRLEDRDDHHAESVELYTFLEKVDFEQGGDSFGFKSGGDGDNGEWLMYMLDMYVEARQAKRKEGVL